ncbi:MAG: AAA family ATPase [Thermoguttaceae bacterium]|jgi:type II secretory pathway predicted ATPase ExeA|nr:AAA family ATPase [Thermoguttaceae bacterium]
MYEPFFEFRKRPFPVVPNADGYFPGEAIEAARTTLVRCIRRAEGPGLAIGPSGTGKTMLCHVLAEEMSDQLRVVLLASGRFDSRRALLQAILYELGRPYRGLDEGEARLALADYIMLSDECPNGILLLVDEAHTLPLRLLDELRMATNLAHEGKPWVRVVLVGGCVLEERFASPKLDSFNQRIAARCYLSSLGAGETQEYIWAQIRLAGGRGESVFPELACQAVYRATDGVPRLINQVCDHALLLACAAGHREISPAHIEEAWADLQQLPTPWNGETGHSSDSGDIIEFGRLDDEAGASADEVEETPDTIPVLRISTETEPDIEGQVDRIEHMLGEVDSEDGEFEPAGSIGPEVELRFDEPHNPFGEEFAEEEIVDDWPGTLGRANFPEPDAGPAADAATEFDAVDAVDGGDDPGCVDSAADPAIERHVPAAEVSDACDTEFAAHELVGALAEDAKSSPAHTVEQCTAGCGEHSCEEDRELPGSADGADESSCTEPDLAPVRAPAVCRVSAGPRPKYSRLFAALRKG